MNMFTDLKKLLTLKLNVAKNEVQNSIVQRKMDQKGKEESSGNVNRLVIRD